MRELVPRERRGRAASRRRHRRGGGPDLLDRARPGCDDGLRPRGGRAGVAVDDLPRARRRPQGDGQDALRAQGRVLRPVRPQRCDPARLHGRHRRRHRHRLLRRLQGHARAAQRRRRARRTGRAPGSRGHVPGPAHLHLPPGRRRPDQCLQLPGVGHAREAGTCLHRRPADDRQAGQPDGLRHRGGRTPHHRVRPPAGRHPSAAVRVTRRAARRARSPGLGGVHRLRLDRRTPAPAPVGAPRRGAARGRGRLPQLLDPRHRRELRGPRVRAVRQGRRHRDDRQGRPEVHRDPPGDRAGGHGGRGRRSHLRPSGEDHRRPSEQRGRADGCPGEPGAARRGPQGRPSPAGLGRDRLRQPRPRRGGRR